MRKTCVALILASALTLIGCGGSTTTSLTATPATTPGSTSSPTTPTSTTPSSAPSGAAPTPTSTGTTSSGTTTTPPPTSTPSQLPTVPSTATVFDNIQDMTTNWFDCSDCAGGVVTSSYYTAPFQTTPSLSGSSRLFSISGPAWASALWSKKFGAHNAATHMLWDFYFYFDATSAAGTWSLELDLWQSVAGQKFMIGSQCVFGENHWDLWDSTVSHWINTGLPCPRFSANTWHHIVWDVERTSATQYRYNTLFVDGTPYPLNKVFGTEPTDWGDDMGLHWQLDQNGSGTPLKLWVDRVKLTIW